MLRMERVKLQHSSYKINSSWKQCGSWSDSFNGSQLLWIHSVTKKDQFLSIFLFILYTGSNSEDPDEMQHKVAFYQDLHCHLQGV